MPETEKVINKIAKGQTLQAFYSTSGVKHLKMKAEISNNTSLYAHSLIKILVDGTHTRSMAKIPNPDFTEDIIAEEDYNGVKAQGRISYLYSSKNKGKLTRPFIIIEGFDPLELVSNANIQMNDRKYGLNSIKTFLYYWYNINYNKYMSLLTEYDVIYIDIFDSKLSIQANAKMFERAIEIINQRKRIDGCTEKNIVFAQSMGGLIARYGLKEMESNNKKHETSVLFCHDTPHLGAHIPLGLLHGIHGIFKFYSKLSLRRLKIKDLQPMIGPVLYSDAAKQMLINYVDENGYLNNSCHEVWQKELSKIGYPQGDDGYKMRILGISNGQTVPIEQQKPYLYVNGKMSLRTLTDIILQYPLLSGLVSGVSGILTKDWQTFLLNLLPGSSTYKLYFEARPPFRGPVCDISLRYVKKYLWTIPIKRTIFSHTSYFPENMIPYDNMPGSYYQLEKKDLPKNDFDPLSKWAKIFIELGCDVKYSDKIMFIPSVSALDLGEGKVKLNQSDYEKIYYMDFPPEYPRHIPFDAYYITNQSTYHTSFETSMINWIFEQMKINIDGPSIAQDGSQYNLRNNTYNQAVNWKSSDESIATIDNSGKLKMLKHGIITISAICNQNNIITKYYKRVMVGFPAYVLDWHLDKSYIIKAKCIEENAKPFLKYLQYEWAKKDYNSTTGLSWEIGADSLQETGAAPVTSQRKTYYFRVRTTEGKRSTPQFLTLDISSPYKIDYPLSQLGNPALVRIRINKQDNPRNYCLQLIYNPNYFDQEALKNDERFRITSVTTKYLYNGSDVQHTQFDSPIKDKKQLYLYELWPNFENTCNQILQGHTTFANTRQVLFKNNEGQIVYVVIVTLYK